VYTEGVCFINLIDIHKVGVVLQKAYLTLLDWHSCPLLTVAAYFIIHLLWWHLHCIWY